jgi:hypothetical protein
LILLSRYRRGLPQYTKKAHPAFHPTSGGWQKPSRESLIPADYAKLTTEISVNFADSLTPGASSSSRYFGPESKELFAG